MKALIISQSALTADKISSLVKQADAGALTLSATSDSIARQKVLDEAFDLAIINSPLSDTNGFELARMIATATDTQVLLMIKEEFFHEATEELKDYGILVISKPIIFQYFRQVIALSEVFKAKLEKLKRENMKLQTRLEESRIVSKAKCLIVVNRNCTEEEAHHLLEKSAMNNRLTLREAAAAYIRRYS
jgi:Response regulator with putative antiterminator output domain